MISNACFNVYRVPHRRPSQCLKIGRLYVLCPGHRGERRGGKSPYNEYGLINTNEENCFVIFV